MIGLSTLTKIAKNGLSGIDRDQVEELLSQMGMEASVLPLEGGQIPWTFEEMAKHTEKLGAKCCLIKVKMKDGSAAYGMTIIVPPQNPLPPS